MYEKYYDSLSKCDLCQGIEMNRYENFLRKIKPVIKSYKKSEYIISRGDQVDFIGIVLCGVVIQKIDRASGTQFVFEIIKEGGSFGQDIIMVPHRTIWPYDYIAKTNCTIMIFTKENIYKGIKDPDVFTNEIFINWLKSISRLMERATIALLSLRNVTVRQKISAFIYEMYLIFQTMQFEIPFNREELAAYLNMPQSSLSREMSSMKKDGIIDYHKSTIKITDLAVLQKNHLY